jgi:hypothetical protein
VVPGIGTIHGFLANSHASADLRRSAADPLRTPRQAVDERLIRLPNDAHAREILRNVRCAVPDDGVLVLIEYCLGEDNTASVGKMVDLVMLAITGGKERTVDEHRALLASAGFQLNTAIPVSPDINRLPPRVLTHTNTHQCTPYQRLSTTMVCIRVSSHITLFDGFEGVSDTVLAQDVVRLTGDVADAGTRARDAGEVIIGAFLDTVNA